MGNVAGDAEHTEPHWLDEQEQRAWRSYIETTQRLLDRTNTNLSVRSGLTLAEYRILVLLSEAPGQSLRMSELADGVLSSRSRLTHQIRRMVDAGLVRRDTCASDGRGVLAVITDAGVRVLTAAAPGHVEDVRRMFVEVIPREFLDRVAELFDAIAARIDAEM
jgi:DNA-binding MarR family transcriptional regulator